MLLQSSSSLHPGGPLAGLIAHLWWFFFSVLISVYVIVMVVLLIAILKRRERQDLDPDLTPNYVTERKTLRIVVSGVLLTAVTLIVFLVMSVRTSRAIASADSPAPMAINVTGTQWWWKVRYEDAVASQTVTTANEIHIPVGKRINLRLMSNDVIHSLWIPSLNGKRDLIPGKDNIVLSIQADKPGIYRGQCAEFCGYQHAKMILYVVAQTPDEFEAWLEHQRAPAVEPDSEITRRGQQVFLTSTCVMCHQIRGTAAAAQVAPDLTHVGNRMRIAGNTLPNTAQHMAEWIFNTQEVKPGAKMPSNRLSADDLQAVVAYLESLK